MIEHKNVNKCKKYYGFVTSVLKTVLSWNFQEMIPTWKAFFWMKNPNLWKMN